MRFVNPLIIDLFHNINSKQSIEQEKASLVNDSKDVRIVSLVRGKLASSLVGIFNNGFNPFTIWGTPHIWDFVQAATAEGTVKKETKKEELPH